MRLETGVPWMMCKQKDAPDPVVGLEQPRRCLVHLVQRPLHPL